MQNPDHMLVCLKADILLHVNNHSLVGLQCRFTWKYNPKYGMWFVCDGISRSQWDILQHTVHMHTAHKHGYTLTVNTLSQAFYIILDTTVRPIHPENHK